MRKLLGGAVFGIGVGALGLWASNDHAGDMEARIAEAAAGVVAGSAHGVSVEVSGRDIDVEGVVDSEAEKASIIAALEAVDGRRIVDDELVILPRVSPYLLEATRSADGMMSATGPVPTEAARSQLGDVASDLTLASGAPDGAWAGAVGQGMAGLSGLIDGTLRVEDRAITLTGMAADPAARDAAITAVGTLPADYTLATDIDVLDDGAPFNLSVDFDGAEASGAGKLPNGLAGADLSTAFGGMDLPGDFATAKIGADSDWPSLATSGLSALSSLEMGRLDIVDRTMQITGSALNPTALADAMAALADVPGDVDLTTEIDLLDDGEPFMLNATLVDGAVSGSGKLPAGLELPDVEGDLTAARIGTTAGFDTASLAGLDALRQLNSGTLDVTESSLTLTGEALNPTVAAAVDAALADLPDGIERTVSLTLLDDGAPVSYAIGFDPAEGASVSGKLPKGLDLDLIADALQIEEVRGNGVTFGMEGDGTPATSMLGRLAEWLPELGGFQIVGDLASATTTAFAAPGVDPVILGTNLEGIEVLPARDTPEVGAERLNLVSGLTERFSGAAWLPLLDFTADAANCTEQTEQVFSAGRINFVTGSFNLDARSIRTINSLAAVGLKCVGEGGLALEVGGHTDSSGAAESNAALSERRAAVVRDAIIARGVPAESITAVGYGESLPIADNETVEGRAANRRTTIVWTE